MLKNLKRREINSELQSRGITTHVKTFPGATAEDMKFYIQPALKSKPATVIVHCGTNNLRSEEQHAVARKIIDVAVQAKSHVPEVMVSTLIKRADSQEIDAKKTQVNNFLISECNRHGLQLINDDNIQSSHLVKWGLHLNFRGTNILTGNPIRSLE